MCLFRIFKKNYSHQCFDPVNSKLYLSRNVMSLEDNFSFSIFFPGLVIKPMFLGITIQQQSIEETNSILHSSYQLPPPVPALPTVPQRLQAIYSAPDGVSQQSSNIPCPISTSTSSSFHTNRELILLQYLNSFPPDHLSRIIDEKDHPFIAKLHVLLIIHPLQHKISHIRLPPGLNQNTPNDY